MSGEEPEPVDIACKAIRSILYFIDNPPPPYLVALLRMAEKAICAKE